jgi:hypothetical protein
MALMSHAYFIYFKIVIMKNKNFILVSIVLVCASCFREESIIKETNNRIVRKVTISDFTKSRVLNSKKFSSINLLTPKRILNLKDYVVVSEVKNDILISIISKETGEIEFKVGVSGKGPGELRYVWTLLNDINEENSFWAYQIVEKRLSKFQVPSEGALSSEEYSLRENGVQYLYIDWINENNFIAVDVENDDKYVELNLRGEKINSSQLWSDLIYQEIPPRNIADLFQGTFRGKGDGSYFALASIDVDHIEIINRKTEKTISIFGPIQHLPEFSIDYSPGYPMLARNRETAIYCYLNIFFGEEKIYGFYSGHSSEKINNFGKVFGEQIFVFDLEGNPLEHYVLDQSICDFTVDEKTRTIYGITIDENPFIVQFKF